MNEPVAHSDYRVQLEAYAGPMDLLLYLVKRHEIDLHDIPIADLTEQYLRHLSVIEAIDVERAGEFLVMAATLLEIKSRMIMPPALEVEGAEGEGDEAAAPEGGSSGADPRFELVQQLLAYKRFKDAAIELELRHDEWMQRYAAAARKPTHGEEAQQRELDLEDVHVMDLCEAFARLLDSIGNKTGHAVTYDDTPISLHAEDIRDRLQREGAMTLRQIFAGRRNRAEMIGLFLATLELVRDRVVRVAQERVGGDVSLELVPEDESSPSEIDLSPMSGDEDTRYDWPDPEAREAAKQRAARRADRLTRIRAGEQTEPSDADDDAFDDLDAPSVDDMLKDID